MIHDLAIGMVIFHSYAQLPEGTRRRCFWDSMLHSLDAPATTGIAIGSGYEAVATNKDGIASCLG